MKTAFILLALTFAHFYSQCQTELLNNGELNSGNYWTQVNNSFLFCSPNFSRYRSSPCYVAMPISSSGDAINNVTGVLKQIVTVPQNVTSIEFSCYINITTEEVTTSQKYDALLISLSEEGKSSFLLTHWLSNLDASSDYTYKKYSFTINDVTNYAGKNIQVGFSAANDGGKPTVFRIDDVSYKVTTKSCIPVSILVEPEDQTINEGLTASFSVDVNGTPPFTYSWYKNGSFVKRTLNTNSTSDSYTTPILSSADDGSYWQCMTENCSTEGQDQTQKAFVTVKTNQSNPSISGNVQPQTNYVGEIFSWTANVIGSTNPNLTVNLELTNPITGIPQSYPMQKISSDKFTFSHRLAAIGEYQFRFQINQTGTYSKVYEGPRTIVKPPTDDYPFRNETSKCHSGNKGCDADPWNMCKHNCTSWVIWKLNQAAGDINLANHNPPSVVHPWNNASFGFLGNAENWDNALTRHFEINQTPAVGAIAHWQKGDAGYTQLSGSNGVGHVAYVTEYDPITGNFEITEYNVKSTARIWNNNEPCSFNRRKLNMKKDLSSRFYEEGVFDNNNSIPGRFIHVEGGKGGSEDTLIVSNRNEISRSFEYLIYPNPNDGMFVIQGINSEEKIISVKVLNLYGNLVFENPNFTLSYDNPSHIDCRNVVPGVYIVLLHEIYSVSQQRIIIQK